MKLTNYVEEHIFTGSIFSKIFASQQAQLDKLNNDLEDLVEQAYIYTATWGLKYWEDSFGIPIDETDTYENRRSRCLAVLRGRGNCTVDYLKEVALSYECGDIEIVEDFENYRFTVKFISQKGKPPKMDDFEKTIRLISPAHLGIKYEFKYNTWKDVSEFTWGEISNFTWSEVMESLLYHNTNYYNKSQLVTNDGFSIVTNDGFGIRLIEMEDSVTYLTDENDNILTDENGNGLY